MHRRIPDKELPAVSLNVASQIRRMLEAARNLGGDRFWWPSPEPGAWRNA